MSQPPSAIPYASASMTTGPLWKLFRLGLILWASLILARHAFYWTNYLMVGGSPASTNTDIRLMCFAGIEVILLILFLVGAICSPRGTHRRFAVLAGVGATFIVIVVVGAVLDAIQIGFSPQTMVRVAWSLVAKIQNLVFPLLCLIGLMTHVGED